MTGSAEEVGLRAATIVLAETAAIEVAATAGLCLEGPGVRLPGVSNVVLGFPNAGVVAKVATRSRAMERLPTEHAIAVELAAQNAPSARPLEDIGPVVHAGTGFVVTLWHYLDVHRTALASDEDCRVALVDLHAALSATTTTVPSFAVELREARGALDSDDFMADLGRSDRAFLRDAFDDGLARLQTFDFAPRRLHGEPHEANRLTTPHGVVWVDFENCCLGPTEWDFAFLPAGVVADNPGVDLALLECLRRLNHARLATWRWGLVRHHPNLRQWAQADLDFLRPSKM